MEANSPTDIFQSEIKPKGSLNTLTILTFIGCGLAYISSIWSFFQSSTARYEKQLADLESLRDNSSGLGSRVAEQSLQTIQKTHDYRYILLVAGLLFTTLCLLGAMQMRQLKKSGYPLYVVGELAPIVITIAIVGLGNMISVASVLLGAILAILFVILYSTQRKYLVY